MQNFKKYTDIVIKIIKSLSEQYEVYVKAADILQTVTINKGLIHIIGTDMHSSSVTEDIFFRQGSLVNINPLFDPGLSVTHSALRSLYIKEVDEYAGLLMDYYRNIKKGDVVIIVDNDGVGKACSEIVSKSREKGLSIIVLTSIEFSKAIDNEFIYRNNQRKNLYEMDVDLVIDNHVPKYDSTIKIEGIKPMLGSVSFLANSYILNTINMLTVEKFLEQGILPEVWDNFHTNKGIKFNEDLSSKYYEIIKHI